MVNATNYFIDRHLEEGRGDNTAIECGDERITYRQLSEDINRFGNGLRKMGIGFGDRIILILPDSPDFFISFFGAIKIGAVPVPISTLLTNPEYEYLLNDSKAQAIVVCEPLVKKIKSLSKDCLPQDGRIIVALGEHESPDVSFADILKDNSSELETHPTEENDVALWLYSSGSTGAPKGCIHLQHDMIVASKNYATGVLAMTPEDKCFSGGKLFFAYGLGNSLFCPLGVGATSILLPAAPKAAAIFDVIERHRPTLFFSVPSNYVRLLTYADESTKKFDLSSIRVFTSAGEPLPPQLFKRFKEKFGGEILDSIGATETFIFFANRPGANHPGSAGQLIPGYNMKILDDLGKPVNVGEVGNLFIESDTVCAGYWNQPEKTKQAIKDNWFRTGDKGYKDALEYFYYVGRLDDMMKCNGAWVNPLEVESVLLEHPAILEAAVVGKRDENDLIKPAAYIVLHNGFGKSLELEAGIREFANSRLPKYKRPRWIVFSSELPRTTTGKLQRFKLREE